MKYELFGEDTRSNLNYAVDEERSTPAKSAASNCVVVGSVSVAEAEDSRKRWKNYGAMRHFQDSWAGKLPNAESEMAVGSTISQIRCKICTKVEGREKLLVPKIDRLFNHAGRRRAMVDMVKNQER